MPVHRVSMDNSQVEVDINLVEMQGVTEEDFKSLSNSRITEFFLTKAISALGENGYRATNVWPQVKDNVININVKIDKNNIPLAKNNIEIDEDNRAEFKMYIKDFLKIGEFTGPDAKASLANFIIEAPTRIDDDKNCIDLLSNFTNSYKIKPLGFFTKSKRNRQLDKLQDALQEFKGEYGFVDLTKIDPDKMKKVSEIVCEVYKDMFDKKGNRTETRLLGESKMENFIKDYISSSPQTQKMLASEGFKGIPENPSFTQKNKI